MSTFDRDRRTEKARPELCGSVDRLPALNLPPEALADVQEQDLVVHPKHNIARLSVDCGPSILAARLFLDLNLSHDFPPSRTLMRGHSDGKKMAAAKSPQDKDFTDARQLRHL